MTNLGNYQTLVVLAKRVGGPKTLAAAFIASGAVLGLGAEHGGKKALGVARKNRGKPPVRRIATTHLMQVDASGVEEGAGLRLKRGDTYRVLEADGDAILIGVLEDPDNPYMVSRQFLQSVSDFP